MTTNSWTTSFATLLTVILAVSILGCDHALTGPAPASDGADTEAMGAQAARGLEGLYTFTGQAFDIDATPNGSILITLNTPASPATSPATYATTTVKEITSRGIQDVRDIQTADSPLNGLKSTGRRSFFATSGGLDLAKAAGVWHVSNGRAKLIGDIEAFETTTDPDADQGLQWKDPLCEVNPDAGFSAGPQSNPYHLAQLSGSTALVADAAGNSLLSAKKNGAVDWVAVFTPTVTDGSGSSNPDDWMPLFSLPDGTCYVQPVPTAVAIGPDGAYYVGELTGVTPANIFDGNPSTELSRVWRIEPGAHNVTCPSDDCSVAFSGFTSVIDVEFGPDGYLYVLEYDENGWFGATALGMPAGGTINRCDVETNTCGPDPVAEGLTLPGAITFDKWGTMWLLENTFAPTVRQVELP